MKKRLLYVGALLTTVLVNAQQKQDSTKVEELQEIIITDSRFKLKRKNSGKTVLKLTQLSLNEVKVKVLPKLSMPKAVLKLMVAEVMADKT